MKIPQEVASLNSHGEIKGYHLCKHCTSLKSQIPDVQIFERFSTVLQTLVFVGFVIPFFSFNTGLHIMFSSTEFTRPV